VTPARILMLLGLALCLTRTCGPARAEPSWSPSAERALRVLCPHHLELAPQVAETARRHLVHPAMLVAMMKPESRCRKRAVNRRTKAYGLLQIKLVGNANPKHLPPVKLLDPAMNLHLGARHFNRCMRICKDSRGGAIRVYHGYKKCSGWKRDSHVLKVLRLFHSVFGRKS
jgi:soluble lytic murein transglycosylase-like protein